VLVLITACGQGTHQSAPAELPYFTNLRPDEAWGRRGPSYKQPVLWEYRRRGLPLLVVDETVFWRQVLDPDGDRVWMHKSLLSNRSIVMVMADKPIPLYRTMGEDQTVVAYADPKALLRLGPCQGTRCQLRKDNIRGWADKSKLWGVDVPKKSLD
jgi:SH3-like domain-containing protein